MEVSWRIIRSIAVTPNWLVLHFRDSSCFLRRQSVTAGDYDQFTTLALIRFREVKQQQRIEAKIIHVDPDILPSYTLARPNPRLFNICLWGLIFFLIGVFISSLGCVAAACVMTQSEAMSLEDYDRLMFISLTVLIGGSVICGLAGLVLGVIGKLPGTRRKK